VKVVVEVVSNIPQIAAIPIPAIAQTVYRNRLTALAPTIASAAKQIAMPTEKVKPYAGVLRVFPILTNEGTLYNTPQTMNEVEIPDVKAEVAPTKAVANTANM